VLDSLSGVMDFSSPWELAAKILIFCLLTGICEEIYFRGFFQGSLSSKLGSRIGVITASLIFAAMHGNPWYFPLYFILGLFFGIVYKKSGTLVAPIFCHALNNAWSILTHNLGIKFPLSESFNYSELTILIPALLFAIYSVSQVKQVFDKRGYKV
nr:CPBP family intramembrane metalloprotease [bacterium]